MANKKIARFVLSGLWFLLLSAVLYVFGSVLIDEPAMRKWIQEELPSFLAPGVEAFLLRVWQPVGAALLTWQGQEYLVEPLIARTASRVGRWARPDFLYIPTQNVQEPTDVLNFRTRAVPATGMDGSLDELSAFLNRSEPFRWWWLTGPGGSGKSRLALEWITALPHGSYYFFGEHHFRKHYDAGFYSGFEPSSDQEEDDGSPFWSTWKLRRPTVIVVDNAAEHPEQVRTMVTTLSKRALNN